VRTIVFGGNGMLGRDIVAAFRHAGTALSAGRSGGDLTADITDVASVRDALDSAQPDVVVNSAAWVDVDGAERHPDETWRANAWGAWNVADACARRGIPLCHISTDYVFDGTKGAPYTEFDPTNPVNVYGASKLGGEHAIARSGASAWIVRTQWLYGTHGNSFPGAIVRMLKEGTPIRAVDDQFGAPTYTPDVAEMLRDIVGGAPFGLYHANNAGGCSRYEFTRAILEGMGRDPALVTPIPSTGMARPARRPANTVMRRLSLEMQGRDHARPWQAALQDYLEKRRTDV
jgi:dTDP-4-dehydrorhamnose reductase